MPTPEELQTLKDKIAPASVQCEKEVGLPAEVTAAQCILETGWLKHAPGNNCFGIKAYPGAFGKQLLPTHEWFNGTELFSFLVSQVGRTASLDPSAKGAATGRRYFAVQDWFAVFPSLGACFSYHARLLLQSHFYSQAFAQYQQDQNQDAFITGIAGHYATDPLYAQKVKELADSQEVKEAVQNARML